MGRIVINETENKQTVILNDTPEGVEGGYFDDEMLWHELEEESGKEWTSDGIAAGTEPNGDVVLSETVTTLIPGFIGSSIRSFTGTGIKTIKSLGVNGIFQGCLNLETISFPELEAEIPAIANDSNVDNYCTVSKLLVPKSEGPHAQSLRGLPNLKKLALPNIKSEPAVNAFQLGNVTKLEKVDFGPNLSKINTYSFANITSITDVVIRSLSLVSLVNSNSMPQHEVKYYVPAALISSYQAASQWSSLYSNGYAVFLSLEGSPYENVYVDGEPVEA